MHVTDNDRYLQLSEKDRAHIQRFEDMMYRVHLEHWEPKVAALMAKTDAISRCREIWQKRQVPE